MAVSAAAATASGGAPVIESPCSSTTSSPDKIFSKVNGSLTNDSMDTSVTSQFSRQSGNGRSLNRLSSSLSWTKRKKGTGVHRRGDVCGLLRRQQQQSIVLHLMAIVLVLLLVSWIISTQSTCFSPPSPSKPLKQKPEPQQRPTVQLDHPRFELQSSKAPVCHPLTSEDDVTITLVTQLSHDRLWMMKHHCQRYPHPMIIAVYSNSTLPEVLDELRGMGCSVDVVQSDLGASQEQRDDDENIEVDDDQVSVHQNKIPLLQVAVLDAQTHGAWNDYPVNELRNLALSLVQSTYIIYIDVDFWTSENLYETLNSSGIKQRLLNDPKQALVIPAFALFRQCWQWKDCKEKNIPKMPKTLEDLAKMLKTKRGNIFDPTNRGGHGSTDYQAWFRQETGSLHDIPCLQSHRYEPFIVIRYCQDLPPFQSAFSGYGKNKVTWMMQVIASGYTLSQVGGIYLVHYPHLDSNSRMHWNEAPQQLRVPVVTNDQTPKEAVYNVRRPKKSDGDLEFGRFKRGQVDQLYDAFLEWLAQTIPASSARLFLCESAQDDDSKLWINPAIKEKRKQHRQKSDENSNNKT